MKKRWTNKTVNEYFNWYQTHFKVLKLQHTFSAEFLMKLYTFYIEGNGIFDFFIAELYKADANGIRYLISSDKFISLSDNIKCAGYFDSGDKVLAAATGHTDTEHWLGIMVHETCHMDQYLEDPLQWKQWEKSPDLDEWLGGTEFSKNKLEKSINNTQSLEYDCERRAVRKIKKYKLPLDIKVYIQKANSYIQFFQYLKTTRKWPVPGKLYNKKIYSKLPSEFSKLESYLTLPDTYKQVYDKYLYV